MGTPYPNPITPAQTQIGWIGIGLMGAAMASRLLSAGYSLTIYARTPSKALSLQSQVAKSCDVVFTIVGHPPDVRQVILETKGVLSGLNPNGVTVDMTTNLPSMAREISAAARARDCWAVDAPVSGADVGAREGKLGIFAGGDAGVVKWLTPLFDIMGNVTYMGEAGCGQSCKIGNNIVGGRAGLDLKQFLEAVRGGAAGSTLMELFGEKMIERDMRPGGFAEYLVKDLGMGVDVVEEEEDGRVVVLPGAALSKQMYSAMVANGDGKLGIHGVISVIDRLNGNISK
ncbi:3-hydroxyisobutyrate dehydrogenase-like 3 [Pyrus ussuriensis x Pyrus communis]|uniref:3-hydroxyisobutyrate dehydrogenase-like 3 n=1 Tax=Pyrus ussuriensis x Pyrus communis TaxID=2448454 RepID=A0A5N5GXR1_9ROSA|nr:3-hydroxyisobutyrate dehydrogenase-like 3 [Pyrus ussuriensis x Pyrus communis]